MKCPLCKIEGRIETSDYVINNGVVSSRLTIKCRNRECPNYNKIFHTDYTPLNPVPDSDAPSEVPSTDE